MGAPALAASAACTALVVVMALMLALVLASAACARQVARRNPFPRFQSLAERFADLEAAPLACLPPWSPATPAGAAAGDEPWAPFAGARAYADVARAFAPAGSPPDPDEPATRAQVCERAAGVAREHGLLLPPAQAASCCGPALAPAARAAVCPADAVARS